jgi:hypothetical protein
MLSDPGSEAQGNPRNMRAVRMPRLLKPARKDGGSLPEARTRVSPETLESQKKPSAIVHEALPQDEKSGPPACEAKYFVLLSHLECSRIKLSLPLATHWHRCAFFLTA